MNPQNLNFNVAVKHSELMLDMADWLRVEPTTSTKSESYHKGGKHPTPRSTASVQTTGSTTRTSFSVTPGSQAVR